MSAQPSEQDSHDVIRLGGETAVVVPVHEYHTLKALRDRASAEQVEEAEIDAAIAEHEAWKAAGRVEALADDPAPLGGSSAAPTVGCASVLTGCCMRSKGAATSRGRRSGAATTGQQQAQGDKRDAEGRRQPGGASGGHVDEGVPVVAVCGDDRVPGRSMSSTAGRSASAAGTMSVPTAP